MAEYTNVAKCITNEVETDLLKPLSIRTCTHGFYVTSL